MTHVIEEFEHWSASYFVALFAGALFDQVLLPEVAAGVDSTGRIRYAPFSRAGRSAASDQLALWGDAAAQQTEFQRLKLLHRDVRGTSPDGVRYSALAPESWNWILLSTMLMYLNSYRAVAEHSMGDDELQSLWEHQLQRFDGLQLAGQHRLPEKYDEAVRYYDEMIRTKAEGTEIFAHVSSQLSRPAAPNGLPAFARPAWAIVAAALIRPLAILSVGITHPEVRTIAGHRWGRRQRTEFALYTNLIRIAHKRLPKRLTYTPLAYNRWRYQRLVNRYEGAGLTSFAPDGGCPIGR